MSDLEITFVCTAINEVLPDLPEIQKDILEETLQSLGVETYDDFQFIQEADLLSAVRPIQDRKVLASWKLRCQTSESSNSSVGASPGPSASLPSPSPRSSPSTSSNSCQSRGDMDWVDTFIVPWEKFPEELMESLERGKRPPPRHRREMVHIIVSEMMKKGSANKRSSTEVAKKILNLCKM